MELLFDQCIRALGKNKEIMSMNVTEEIFQLFEDAFPITKWGRIDWDKVSKKIKIKSIDEVDDCLEKLIKNFDTNIFIIWNDASLPAIKTDLNDTLKVINDITAVSFDTWLFCPSSKYIIEFFHEGEITIGIASF